MEALVLDAMRAPSNGAVARFTNQLGPLLVVRMVGFCERTNEREELQPRMLSGEDQIAV